MEVSLAVLADSANVSVEGKLNILGEFDTVFAKETPTALPMMVLVLRLEAEPNEAKSYPLEIRVVDEKKEVVGKLGGARVDFPKPPRSGVPRRSQTILNIQGAYFPAHGAYGFEVWVGGKLLRRVPLFVLPPTE